MRLTSSQVHFSGHIACKKKLHKVNKNTRLLRILENIFVKLDNILNIWGSLHETFAVITKRIRGLEPVCSKKWQKKGPNQETGLGNRGPLEALNDTKLILND